jgi:polyhydroxyalkanoate synthesis regulator phasin
MLRALKLEQAKELTKLRQEFELSARELGVKYEKKMKMLRDDLELRRKQEIHEVEERKVRLVRLLMWVLRSKQRVYFKQKWLYTGQTLV